MTNFDIIRNDRRLLYEYIRGSHLYGLNNELSDVDTSGVYVCTRNELFGCSGYKPQVSDARHDNTWFEIGELVRLLLKSNPTVMESLFVPEDKILGQMHPLMQMLIDNREQFISKQCFNPFFGYAKSQIEKARGLNKKIVNPVMERLTPYDFIYTFKGQGSTKFSDWLANRGLYQEHCGLVNVPNMHEIYGVYYDFGTHIATHRDWSVNLPFLAYACNYYKDKDIMETKSRLSEMSPIGYRGVISADADGNELRLSSIDAKRYESNLNKTYDSKNMMHCFRLMHMASEIAEGKGMILQRTWDRQFLMDVRNHKFEYEEIIDRLEEEKKHMNKLMEQSSIREMIDTDFVNQLMIDIRKKQLGM